MNFNIRDQHELFNRLNVRSINLTYQKFNGEKGALAPMGISWSFGIKYLFIDSEIIDKRTNFGREFGELFEHGPLLTPTEANFFVLKFGLENTQIIKDRIVFKAGLKFGLPLNQVYLSNLGSTIEGVYPSSTKEDEVVDFEFPVYRRLFFHELFRFDIGVGLLLF